MLIGIETGLNWLKPEAMYIGHFYKILKKVLTNTFLLVIVCKRVITSVGDYYQRQYSA